MNLQNYILKESIAPPENWGLIKKYLNENLTENYSATFISWKMPQITISNNRIKIYEMFDTKEAEKYIERESNFLNLLESSKVKYHYLKIIPDDLPTSFWNIQNYEKFNEFGKQVERFFKKYCINTKVYLITDLAKKYRLTNEYKEVYNAVLDDILNQRIKIDPDKLNKEISFRTKHYSIDSLTKSDSKKIAIKAFALFASESYLLYQLSRLDRLGNIIMLAGTRSDDTYKYDFVKLPKNRPVLPKLFII